MDLIKTFQFEAAHRNPAGHEAQVRVHGHSYRVELIVKGECDSQLGWLVDYAEIARLFEPLYVQLDHRYLNDVDGLEDATLPRIGTWIEERLHPNLPELDGVRVSIVGKAGFNLESQEADRDIGLDPRLAFSFEAAHFLPKLPESHKCRRLHGHSFRIETGAASPGVLRGPVRAIYDALDHRNLNEIAGLENPTSERVSKWIFDRLAADVPAVSVVVVAETCMARCMYFGSSRHA